MGLLSEIQRRRAESERAAAESWPKVVLVVTAEAPVGRTVVRREVLSPWAKRALRGELPTGGTAPIIEGR
jgi:hypothetical protein